MTSAARAAAIYLSGQFEDGLLLCQIRQTLADTGYSITSRWLDAASTGPATARTDDEGAAARLTGIARQDFEDIATADLVVVLNPRESANVGRGGRHVETGFALAIRKRVIVVGARSNVFHWLPEVTVVADWPELHALLEVEYPIPRSRMSVTSQE